MCAKMWRQISCTRLQLQLKATLTGGQSFRWKIVKNDDIPENNEYLGVMANILWLLRQSDSHLQYKVLGELPYTNRQRIKVAEPQRVPGDGDLLYPGKYYEDLLIMYFRLDINLEEYYSKWCEAHDHFKSTAGQFHGIRVLNQDPVENLFSFICSQNNHISRISSMVEKLCTKYGQRICEYEETAYHAFPNIESLAEKNVETDLRQNGFGYRAKYFQKSAGQIVEKGGLEWFAELEKKEYMDARSELMTLTGIGPKVADCICLMSLSHLQAIPVDTHVYQIACSYYLKKLQKSKSVTTKIYQDIGDEFKNIYGPLAGWAQTVLFCADLRQFKDGKAVKRKAE
ncbi:N-glycosylase/DNA lyase [Phlebotomus argentipes]|uniref:N-glycosylase/DNA lyase n=1 Tax=Phlebotomus argentipes TaxID=94469 RepID=UPI002892C1F2|nr:N-glycosylase/DNA lyase [Phlebotomus argentipes]